MSAILNRLVNPQGCIEHNCLPRICELTSYSWQDLNPLIDYPGYDIFCSRSGIKFSFLFILIRNGIEPS